MMKNIIRNAQHLNSAMAGTRKISKNKNYYNQNYMNGLLLIIYLMALMFPTYSTLEVESNKIRCSDAMTCTKCAIKLMCVWSLKQQQCRNKGQSNASSLIINTIEECPKFSVIQKHDYSNDEDLSKIHLDYIIEVTNDLVGFINYLSRSRIYCVSLKGSTVQSQKISKTKILCQFLKTKSKLNVNEPTVTHFIFIQFNDVMLRFNNVADHYVTVYKNEECVNYEKYKNCATCGWNTNGYLNYLKWCPSEDTCIDHRNVYMKNNDTDKLNENVAYVTNDCAEINVTAVDPLSGPRTGGTTVTIIVKNHRIFIENRTLNVTVAGTACTDPKTSSLETITCITSEAVGTLSGPVLVEYSSNDGALKIESSQIFQFCHNHVLDADQQLCGDTVMGRTSTHPDDPTKLPGWFLVVIVISTVLIFVFVLVHNVTKSTRNPLGTSTDLHNLSYKHSEL